ncbi:MAG: hypothetical protein ACE5FT_02810 [Candidatus Nanoarchaeia archaeon]
MSEKLVDYIKKGVKQGFNTDYIRKVLHKHGYSKSEVEFAIAKATGHKAKPKQKPTMLAVAIVTVCCILILILLGGYSKSRAKTAELSEQVEEQGRSVQQYLDQVADLTQEIDAKEKTIDQQLKELRSKDITLEEKDDVIDELDFIYQKMKQERRDVRDLLVELLKEVVERYKPGSSTQIVGEPILGDDLTIDMDAPDVHTTT